MLLSFSKKHNTVYSLFIKSWKNVSEKKDISNSLEAMGECIIYEQREKVHPKSTEYILENDILFSICKLCDYGMHKEVGEFVTKVFGALTKEYLIKIEPIVIAMIQRDLVGLSSDSNTSNEERAKMTVSPSPSYIHMVLIYVERLVAQNLSINTHIIDYALQYIFLNGIYGEYSRATLIYCLYDKNSFIYLNSIGFIYRLVNRMNKIYVDKNFDADFYVSLIELLSFYLCKEEELINKNVDKHNIIFPGKTLERKNILEIKSSVWDKKDGKCSNCKMFSASEVNEDEAQSSQKYLSNNTQVLQDLNLDFLHIDQYPLYIKILRSTTLDIIINKVIEIALDHVTNTSDCKAFFKYVIRSNPSQLAPYFQTSEYTQWSPNEVYSALTTNQRDFKIFMCPSIISPDTKGCYIDRFVSCNYDDEDIYLFMFLACRTAFFGKSKEIFQVMNENQYFFGSLYRLIIQ